MKNTIWVEHVGDKLYLEHKTHLEGALNCTTKEEYDHNVAQVYEGFKSYPEFVKYFHGYFDDPSSIAKYSISMIRGGLCTITSAAAEQTHSSNENSLPTKCMGLVIPEKHNM